MESKTDVMEVTEKEVSTECEPQKRETTEKKKR